MNKIIKSLSLALSAAALLVSCNDVEEAAAVMPEGANGEVSFTSSIDTRVVNNQFETGDQIFVQSFDVDGNVGLYGTYSYDAATFVSDSDVKITHVEGEELSYVAIYPAVSNGSEYTNTQSSFSFSVQADQSTLEGVSLSQLMFGEASATAADQTELKFVNQMSKVTLAVMVDFVATSASVSYNLKAEALVNAAAGTSMASTADAVAIAPYANGTTYEVVAAPQTVAAGETIATATYNSTTYSWVASADAVMSAGSIYEYTLFIHTADGTAVAVHNDSVQDYIDNYNGGTDPDPDPDPEPDATLDIDTTPIKFVSDSGASTTVSYTTNQETVAASTTASWLSVSASNGVLTIATTEENTTGEERSTTVTITAGEGDNTASASIAVSQETVEVPSLDLAIGDIYTDENGSSGLVYYVDDAEVHMVSVTELYGTPWSTLTTLDDDVYALSANNGDYSSSEVKALGFSQIVFDTITATDTYKADSSKYPIFAWAESLGDGWIIPGRADLEYIEDAFSSTYANYTTALVAAGGSALQNQKYWMAMLKSDGSTAVSGNFVTGSYTTYDSYSSTSRYARAIKIIKL